MILTQTNTRSGLNLQMSESEKNLPDTKVIHTLALELLNQMHHNEIQYSPGYECWAKRESDGSDTWLPLRYNNVMEFADYCLQKKTNKKPSVLLVKQVLSQIEQWILKSEGRLVQVQWDDGSSTWCPACIVDFVEE